MGEKATGKRRYKRELARINRGVSAEQIEDNLAAGLTPEQRKENKAKADAARNASPEQRELNRRRKAEQRAKRKAEEQAKIAARAIF
jgi:hypothetical protein